jgi:hypothetical protein
MVLDLARRSMTPANRLQPEQLEFCCIQSPAARNRRAVEALGTLKFIVNLDPLCALRRPQFPSSVARSPAHGCFQLSLGGSSIAHSHARRVFSNITGPDEISVSPLRA